MLSSIVKINKNLRRIKMDKILVHICCGVDAVWALRKLKEEYPDAYLEGFFYDPNIHPEEEYELRWIETKRVCNDLHIPCEKGDYDIENWFNAVKGYENEPERGERCSICHDVRLEKSAQYAKEKGFNKFTTVLMMSPKKDFEVLKNIGEKIGEKYGLEFLSVEFRKNGGMEKMNKLAKEKELYHQNYCGCIYGLFQQRKGFEYIPELVKFSKEILPGSTEEKLFIKEIRLFAEEQGIQCSEEEFFFINWKVLSSSLKIGKEYVAHEVLPYSAPIKGILRDKVKEVIQRDDKKILKFYKSPTQVWIVNDLNKVSVDKPRFISNPVFIVESIYVNIDDKFEFQLKTEIQHDSKSQNLTIGDKNSHTLIEFTTNDKREEIKKFIIENKDRLKTGQLKILIYGASNNKYGNIGKFLTEETGIII
jgi:hypothetical protein